MQIARIRRRCLALPRYGLSVKANRRPTIAGGDPRFRHFRKGADTFFFDIRSTTKVKGQIE
jgi:hypothetical protein